MKKLMVFIQNLKSTWFPTKEDTIWKQWVDFKGERGDGDLVGLLSSSVRDSFKKRALFLLLVPSAELNPIYWKGEVGKFHKWSGFLKSLKSLSPDLLNYATELITKFCVTLGPVHCDRPTNIVSGGDGIKIFMQVPDKFHAALSFYNSCLLTLLGALPVKQGEEVFPLFRLLDISVYDNMEDCSGYGPLQSLLSAKWVNEIFKIKADDEMRKIIQNEISGKAKPRAEWEGALRCYAEVIQNQINSELSYSVDLFARQISFIIDNCQPGDQLIKDWKIVKIFSILSDDGYKDLRYKIAKSVVLGGQRGFSIYNEETVQAADMILTEFGHQDPALASKLILLIDTHKEKQAEEVKQQLLAQEAEDELMAQMK